MAIALLPIGTAGLTLKAMLWRFSDGYVWNGSAFVATSGVTSAALAGYALSVSALATSDPTTIGYYLTIPAGAAATPCRVSFYTTSYTAGKSETYGVDYQPTMEVEWVDGGRLDLIQDIIAANTTTDIPALIGVAGAGLSAIPDMATATAQAIIAGYLDTEIGTIITAVGTTIPALIGTPAVDLATDLAAAQTDLDTITDTGVSLVATGLDAITATEPTAKPTNFREWLMWLVQRYRRSSKTTTVLTVSTEAGAAVTTQVITDDGAGTETLGPPT